MSGFPSTDVQHGYRVDSVIARVLGIDLRNIHDNLSYQSIPEWDSIRHIALILALEETFGIPVGEEFIAELQDVSTIRAFFDRSQPGGGSTQKAEIINGNDGLKPAIDRGLAKILLDNTLISRVEGESGVLEYRGYSIHDLVSCSSFEQVAYLLIHGEVPDGEELREFTGILCRARALPSPVLELIYSLRDAHPMDALRTSVSALAAFDPGGVQDGSEQRIGLELIAKVLTIIGAHHAARLGRAFELPSASLSSAEFLLSLLLQRPPTGPEIKLMDRDMILHADLAANPSALAARVAISCKAGMYAAITAAVSAFAGPLHGGAAEQAVKMIDEVGKPERASNYVSKRWANNEPVMGFGHRVFRVDPRVRHFREAALRISLEQGDLREFEILEALVKAMKPYGRYGASPNVDLYAGLIYRKLGLPDDLTVPIFVAGRMAGWVAQAIEQEKSNILIYPLLNYVGPPVRAYPASGAASQHSAL